MTDGLKDAHREAIIAVIAANDRVERAVLFGSRATGTNTVTSDVDIALFGDQLTLTDRARLSAVIDQIPMAQSVDLLARLASPPTQRTGRCFASRSCWKDRFVSADEWQSLVRAFQQRHLIAHRMGVVDQDYIAKSNRQLPRISW